MTASDFSPTNDADLLLPGLVRRSEYARRALNAGDKTAKRLQDAGQLVVHYVGRVPYVDIEATARRIRGEERRRGRKPRAAA
jgi:hypothetical protein